MTEGLVLSCLAAVSGVLLAAWLPAVILAAMTSTPMALQLQPDIRVLAFTLGVVLLSSVAFGLALLAAHAAPLRAGRGCRRVARVGGDHDSDGITRGGSRSAAGVTYAVRPDHRTTVRRSSADRIRAVSLALV
jgi:hypothetical protein